MIRKVLITGASEFIGYHLISAATGAGMNMHASEAGTKIPQLQHFNLRNVIPDYTDQDSLCELPKEQQTLTASPIYSGYNMSDRHSHDRYLPENISKHVPGVHMFRIHVPAIVTLINPKLARNIYWYTNNKWF